MWWGFLAIMYVLIVGTSIAYFWLNEYILIESQDWSQRTKKMYAVWWHLASVFWLPVLVWYAMTVLLKSYSRDMDGG